MAATPILKPVPPAAPVEALPSPAIRDCIICCETMDHWMVPSCNHRYLCALCGIRQRLFYNQLECCVCKVDCPKVVCTADPVTPYELFDMSKMRWDATFKTYFTEAEYHKEILSLNKYVCPVEGCGAVDAFKNVGAWKAHLRKVHGRFPCDTCTKKKRTFKSELSVYSKAELKQHQQNGAGEPSFNGHPKCQFCNEYYMDEDDLYAHMKNHFTCQICESDGIMHQFYNTRTDLSDHLKQNHFSCQDPECLRDEVIAFKTKAELKSHNLSAHKGKFTKAERHNMRQLDINVTFNDDGEGRGGHDRYERRDQRQDQRGRGRGRGRSSRGRPPGRAQSQGKVHMEGDGEDYDEDMARALVASARETAQTTAPPEAARAAPVQDQPPAPLKPLTPEEIKERNSRLVQTIRTLLGEDGFKVFQRISGEFRKNSLSVVAYHAAFCELFKGNVDAVFDDLVALLPDQNKSKQLQAIHADHLAAAAARARAAPSPPDEAAFPLPVTASGQSVAAPARAQPAQRAEAFPSLAPSSTGRKPGGQSLLEYKSKGSKRSYKKEPLGPAPGARTAAGAGRGRGPPVSSAVPTASAGGKKKNKKGRGKPLPPASQEDAWSSQEEKFECLMCGGMFLARSKAAHYSSCNGPPDPTPLPTASEMPFTADEFYGGRGRDYGKAAGGQPARGGEADFPSLGGSGAPAAAPRWGPSDPPPLGGRRGEGQGQQQQKTKKKRGRQKNKVVLSAWG